MSEDPVKELCDALHDESDQTKAEALMQLAQLLDGTPEGKATVALCGAILQALLRVWPTDRLSVADRGLREGLLYAQMSADGVLEDGSY